MPKFTVILTKDTTVSTTVTVEADNVSAAEQAALEQAGRYGEEVTGWTDDENMSRPYTTGCDLVEGNTQSKNETKKPAIEEEREIYLFEVTGGFDVRKDLKPELSAYGDVIKFRLPDGKAAQLIVALEIEIDDGMSYEYVTSEKEMSKLGLEGLDYNQLRFIKKD